MGPLRLLVTCATLAATAVSARAACDLDGLAGGTEVAEIVTSVGTICLELLSDDTPDHVENFFHYLDAGEMDDTLFHRASPAFVMQGAGFRIDGDGYAAVPASGPHQFGVPNEPCTRDIPAPPPAAPGTMICSERGNERGNVSLAKQGGLPSSGTTNWFVNLDDNRANLDNQNGGFTVFARVIEGMDVVDAIDSFDRAGSDRVFWADPDFANAFSDAPLQSDLPLGPPFGCFDPDDLAAVVSPANPNQALPDPVEPGFFFVSGACGTPIDLDDFVENPGPPGCTDADRLAIGVMGPAPPVVPRTDPMTSENLYFSLTCEQTQEALAQRPLWRADFRARFDAELVFIESTQRIVVPEPEAVRLGAAALCVLGLLARRRATGGGG